LAGVQPAGQAVRVSYPVVYDLRGNQISKRRPHFPIGQFVERLTG
jgi:hypothetical protein